jgi:glycosyltransferase involved in cell wall biosynthesis
MSSNLNFTIKSQNSEQRIKSFSVIVPVYNCEKVVPRTLASICDSIDFFQKNYPYSQEVMGEIVVVDDHSTDQTLSAVVAFAQNKPGLFKVVGHKNNRGAGAARNTGVNNSQGEILFFCDGDDLFLPPHILICFLILQGKTGDIANVPINYGDQIINLQLREERPDVVRTGVKMKENIHPQWKKAIENSLPLNLCLRRKCHEFVEGFPEDEVFKKIGGAEDTTYQRYLDTFFKIAKTDLETVEYIRYPGNSLDRQMPKFELPPGEYKGSLPHEKGKEHLFQEANQIENRKLIDLKGKLAKYKYLLDCQVKQYKFTQDWFSINIPIWEKFIAKFANLSNLNFLEIGSWEGRATCWLLDRILTDKSSRITCIDTFAGAIEHQTLGEKFLNSVELRFDYNINQSGSKDKVKKIVGFSQEILRELPLNSYDFIYIDGSHIAPEVLEDTVLAWRLLKEKGMLVFDDYQWNMYRDKPTFHPRLAIDSFLTVFQDHINIIHIGYQVIIEKK